MDPSQLYALSQQNLLNTVTQGDGVTDTQQPVMGPLQQADDYRRRRMGAPRMQSSMGGGSAASPFSQHIQQHLAAANGPYTTPGSATPEQFQSGIYGPPAAAQPAVKPDAHAESWKNFMPSQSAGANAGTNAGSSFAGTGLTDIAKATPQTEAQVKSMAGGWQQAPAQSSMNFSGDEQALLQAVQSAGGTPMDGLRMILEQRNKAAAGSGKKEKADFLTDTEAAEGGKHYASDTAEADVEREQRKKAAAGEDRSIFKREDELNRKGDDLTDAEKAEKADLAVKDRQQFNMARYGYGGNQNATTPEEIAQQQRGQQQHTLPVGDGDQITPDEAQAFLNAAGGDPNAARQLAAQHGHTF